MIMITDNLLSSLLVAAAIADFCVAISEVRAECLKSSRML
jgi:hypothetical protein